MDEPQKKSSFLGLVLSTLAAAIGVQNRKNLERDFEHKSPMPFIVAGITFTVIFVVSLIVIVKVVLNYAT